MDTHKKWVKDVFDRAAPTYGEGYSSFFSYFGKRLVDQAGDLQNLKVLDVATGKGAVLFPLKEKVGVLGKITAIDISAEMIKAISQEKGIDFHVMDAEELHFADQSFDAVFCGFALFFFPNLEKALSEFKRVLKPNGKLVVSVWGKVPELSQWVKVEARKLITQKDLKTTPLDTGDKLYDLLTRAQLKNVKIIEEKKEFSHTSKEAWWDSLWSHGTRASLEALSNEDLYNLRKRAFQHPLLEQGVKETLQVFYGVAEV